MNTPSLNHEYASCGRVVQYGVVKMMQEYVFEGADELASLEVSLNRPGSFKVAQIKVSRNFQSEI